MCAAADSQPEKIAAQLKLGWLTVSSDIPGIFDDAPLHTPEQREANAVETAFFIKLSEAQALEYAGDVNGAIACYESMLSSPCRRRHAHERLAVIYKKLDRAADEERILRDALARDFETPRSFFAVRLQNLLAKKAVEEITRVAAGPALLPTERDAALASLREWLQTLHTILAKDLSPTQRRALRKGAAKMMDIVAQLQNSTHEQFTQPENGND